ncbi:MAG: ATP-dependent Clp protease proteolytic subunit [Pseudomonadota bacterium]
MDDDEDDDKVKAQQSIPVDKHLFEARQVMIVGQITMDLARDVCQRLLALAHVSNDPITVIVSSPGGHVESGDMIHDTISLIEPDVNMLGMGWVASSGALIYISVPRERRFCTPNTRFLLHQPSGGAGGAASDIEIQAREIIKMRERLNILFANATGQPLDRIETDTDRDHWMGADEAIEYGLVNRVVRSVGDIG